MVTHVYATDPKQPACADMMPLTELNYVAGVIKGGACRNTDTNTQCKHLPRY